MLDKNKTRGKKNPVTFSHTIKCFGIEQSPERVLTCILLSLCMRILHALWAADIRCPFMRSSADTHWPHTLWLPKAHIKSNIPLKFDWNWNEKIQEPCDMAPGVPFLPTRSLRQSAIRNIRYACVAAGYFTGLETSIISQQPSVWNESAAILSMCQSNRHQRAASSMRNVPLFELLSKRYRKVTWVFFFSLSP